MKKFAVVIAGCGVYDGAEIHEAVMTLLAIKKQGAEYAVFAPDTEQHHVVNHFTGKEMQEKRNVLVESARIARGNIRPLSDFKATDYDALIFPGGFGVAKNLCDFAFKGEACSVHPEVERAVKETHKLGKPVGALCISPVILAKVLGKVELTIGSDPGTAAALGKMGAIHKNTSHGEVIIDPENNIYTTPCYMLDAEITDIEAGAMNVVAAMLKSLE